MPALTASCCRRLRGPEELADVDRLLGEIESARNLPVGGISILPLVETALGIVRCEEIALTAPARVLTLVFGLGDFSADMCVDLSMDGTELLYARSRVAVAARAARMPPALDGPYPDLRDTRGLITDTRRSRQLGFQGRVAIYPPQVEAIHRAYSDLAPEEVAFARKIVSSFETAEASGSASIQIDGQFIDYPIYERARQKIQRFEALEAEGARMNADQLINDAIDRLESREEIDARELLGAFLERIEKWQPVINAFITLTPDVARADAGRLERDREAGEQVGPLAGMVVAVKDDIDVGGVRCTVGSPIHAERVPGSCFRGGDPSIGPDPPPGPVSGSPIARDSFHVLPRVESRQYSPTPDHQGRPPHMTTDAPFPALFGKAVSVETYGARKGVGDGR